MKITILRTGDKLNNIMILTVILTAVVISKAHSQFRITAMQGEGGSEWVILKTLQEPGLGKQTNVRVSYNPNKIYNSGTVFQTSNNSRIRLQYRGQMIELQPNTAVQTKVYPKGASVQSFGGRLRATLKDVKAKLGFFKVGNGYVWAHAEGTVFDVSSNTNSKQINFQTQSNSIINVTDHVEVIISGSKVARPVIVSQQVGSNSSYASGSLPPRSFNSNQQYLQWLESRITSGLNNLDYYQLEGVGEAYLLLGFYYDQRGNLQLAYDYYDKAYYYYNQWEPNGVDAKNCILSKAEILIKDGQVVKGQNIVRLLLPSLKDDLNYYYDACHYWYVIDNIQTAYDLLGNDQLYEEYEELYYKYLELCDD